MSLKTLLEYQLSSGGWVDIPIETIREYILDEITTNQSHTTICRVLETLTGYRVD
jgi:hypothetical protein